MSNEISNNVLTIDSREVAEMLEKQHWMVLRDIEGSKDGKTKGIIDVLNDNKIVVVDFFIESSYKDAKGETRKSYLVTKKGCEVLANKMKWNNNYNNLDCQKLIKKHFKNYYYK